MYLDKIGLIRFPPCAACRSFCAFSLWSLSLGLLELVLGTAQLPGRVSPSSRSGPTAAL